MLHLRNRFSLLKVKSIFEETTDLTKKITPCVLTFGILLIIFSVSFIIYRLYPFGENSVSWCDMSQQVIPLGFQFEDILSGSQGIFLNLSSAGGINFWGIFFFFLASPFTFIISLFDKSDYMLIINLMVVAKMILAGLFACKFFIKITSLHVVATSLLSVCYALSGYSLMYYQNIVWLDAVYLFPLLLLSAIHLREKQKIIPFTLCLVLIVITQFQIAVTVAIFILLSMSIYYFYYKNKQSTNRIIYLVTTSSVFALLISTPVWLVSFLLYQNSARPTNIITGIGDSVLWGSLTTALPLIISTSIIVAGFIIFFFCKKSKQNTNIRFIFTLFILTLFPIFFEPVNKMWHGGSYQAFPSRFAFITVLLGLTLVAKLLEQTDDFSEKFKYIVSKYLLRIFPFLVVCLIALSVYLMSSFSHELTRYTQSLWGNASSLLFLSFFIIPATLCYFIFIFYYKSEQSRMDNHTLGKKGMLSSPVFKTIMTVATVLILFTESIFNIGVYMGMPNKYIMNLDNPLVLEGKIDDNSLYNIDTFKEYFDANFIGAAGYNSLAHYTSLVSEDFLFSMKKLGYSSYWMDISGYGGTELTDFLLANKYTIYELSDAPKFKTDGYAYSDINYKIYENKHFMSYAKIIDNPLLESFNSTSRFEIQNELYRSIFSTSDDIADNYLLAPVNPIRLDNLSINYSIGKYHIRKQSLGDSASILYKIPYDENYSYYFDLYDITTSNLEEEINGSFNISVNGNEIATEYPSKKNNGIIDISNSFTPGVNYVNITVLTDSIDAASFGMYSLDLNKLSGAQTGIAQNNEPSVKQNANILTVTTTAKSGDFLFLPIQYSDNIDAKIINSSGETHRAEVLKSVGAFISIELLDGDNTVVLEFGAPALGLSLIISLVAIMLFFILLYFKKTKKKRIKKI